MTTIHSLRNPKDVAAHTCHVYFHKLNPAAVIPEYQTLGSSGMDLHSVEVCTVEPGKTAMIDTGLTMELPPGYEAQVRPRSGLAAKHGVTVLNTPGTIDSDYRGPVKVILINHGDRPFVVNVGDRIAQMVIARVEHALAFDKTGQTVSKTTRGTGGFGSTGV